MKLRSKLAAIAAIYILTLGRELGLFYLTKDLESIPSLCRMPRPFCFLLPPKGDKMISRIVMLLVVFLCITKPPIWFSIVLILAFIFGGLIEANLFWKSRR